MTSSITLNSVLRLDLEKDSQKPQPKQLFMAMISSLRESKTGRAPFFVLCLISDVHLQMHEIALYGTLVEHVQQDSCTLVMDYKLARPNKHL